jgi:hypothetical protein
VSTGDWLVFASVLLGVPGVIFGGLQLRNSMRSDARQQQTDQRAELNRLQDRIWQLEDQLREKHGDD